MFEITENKIDTDNIIESVSSEKAGGISVFIGVTRNFTKDKNVEYLFYEAYHSMAIKQMKKIGDLVVEKFKVQKIAITHRIGRVDVKEASVVIAVSASHRGDAINACHYAIDTLKDIVPIWKKEFMVDGDPEWIANSTKNFN